MPAAKAAMAAHNQGKFWEFHDRLFADTPLNNDKIKQIAVDLGLDMDRYEKDMNSPAVQQLVIRDLREGQDVGVRGTPTLFLNGAPVKNRSPAGIQEMIDTQLAKREARKTSSEK